jgi:DNA invertase Pin-like site-specific DNA recombinase
MTSQKLNILYGRLSQEDARAGDSNSIINQRLLLEKYAKENGFQNTIFLADDGYSGTNFDRPSWKKIEEMIERGEVETLIVKDLSRLGREYLQVGYYTELYFPKMGVRFIAVNDGVDSLIESSNDFSPIRNWTNELHAKDSSKKVRAVKKLQAERGERLGGRPPYGYKKVDKDSKEIIPDEDAAIIVKRIFAMCIAGKGPNQIARILSNEKIVNPTNYYYQTYGKGHQKLDTTHPYNWIGSTITAILDNMAYLGHTVGLRHTTISYKNKKAIIRPDHECVIVENTHPALVTKEQWDIVQDLRKQKKRVSKHMEEPNIFSGITFCADCGRSMVLHRASTMKKSNYNFKCYTYGKRGKAECTPHHIREEELYEIILDDLRRVTHIARMKDRQFAEYINRKNSVELRREITALQRELDTMNKRRDELTALFKRLYEDNVLGRITNEQFRLLSGDYNDEQNGLDEAIPQKEEQLEKLKSSADNVNAFIEKAKKYKSIDVLTPEIVRLFIERIEIGERTEKYSRHSVQKIRIVYRDIGEWDKIAETEEKPTQYPEIISESA